MLVLVTGATGFIGGETARTLAREGLAVRALVRPGREGPLAGIPGIEIATGDLGDADSLRAACRGVDALVHAAGALGRWGVREADLREVNVAGTARLLEAALEAGVENVVHLSAAGVSGPMGPVPAGEDRPCRPRTPYEKTKLEGERVALDLHRRRGLPLTVLRPAFTYGPGDLHKLAIFRAVRSGRIVLLGGGESLIHPVFVRDVVRAVRRALEVAGRGETYLIGGPRPVTKRELLDAIASSLGIERRWRRLPRRLAFAAALVAEGVGRLAGKAPPLTRGRVWMMGWSFGYRIDKAQAGLGFRPITDLRTGIARTTAWYREQGLLG